VQPKQNFTTHLTGHWQTKNELPTLEMDSLFSKQLEEGEIMCYMTQILGGCYEGEEDIAPKWAIL
jgi:hypothetical protein